MLRLVKYTLSNAPWTLIASMAQPLSNYVIIILLSQFYGLAEGGRFRLLLSIFAILALFTLIDSGKIVVKYLVMAHSGVVRPLLFNRMRWALAGLFAGVAGALLIHQKEDNLWVALLVAAVLLPISEPASLYAQINQAKKQFRLAAIYSISKFTSATALVPVCFYLNLDVIYFFAGYFIILGAFNVAFILLHEETFQPAGVNAPTYIKESVQLSASGLFPVILEHADKFIVSYFLGLEALALYAVGISTGRLLLNFVRPVLVIYFPILVDQRPTARFVALAFALLSCVGVAAAWLLQYYFGGVLEAKFLPAYPLAAVIVAGLGVHFSSVIVYYSSVYHRGSRIIIPTVTNIITSALVIAYLGAAIMYAGAYALVLCAASYPLRDLLNLIITVAMSKRFGIDANADPVH